MGLSKPQRNTEGREKRSGAGGQDEELATYRSSSGDAAAPPQQRSLRAARGSLGCIGVARNRGSGAAWESKRLSDGVVAAAVGGLGPEEGWGRGGQSRRDVTAETSLAAALSVCVSDLFAAFFSPFPRADAGWGFGSPRRCLPCGANPAGAGDGGGYTGNHPM